MIAAAKTALKKLNVMMNSGLRNLVSFYKNMPIRIKLMLILNIAILVPLVTISFVCFKNSEDVLKNKSINYSQDILKIITMRLNDYISSLDSISTDMLGSSLINSYIQNDKISEDNVTVYHTQDNVRDYLKNQIRIRGEVQSIGVYLLNSNLPNCYADDNSQRESIQKILPKDSKLYYELLEKVEKSEGEPVWYLDSSKGKVKHIFYARAINDRDNYKMCGMLVLMVKQDWFNTVFNGLINEDMKKTAVLSDNMEVILSRSGADSYALSKEMFGKMNGSHGFFTDMKQNTLISYITVDKTGWKIVSYIPLSTLYSDVEYIKQRIIISLICAVLLMLLISFYISYDFVTAINALVGGMKRLQNGEVNVEVKLDRKDELGFMGTSFNTMVKEITTLQKWILREQLTRKDAQIKALQSQINPHFLFNTLESINWMAQLKGVPEISETVTALASLMDASIARSGKFITLAQELNYIDNYILIMKKRFEGRLELNKEIDPELLEVKVPRLLIQPLVENAINHGVANYRGKGVVKVTAAKFNELIRITVEDNGAGIDPDELEIINGRLSMNDEDYFKYAENNGLRGIGLENVNCRIKLFYGPQYGIKIESKKGSFTKIYFDIPHEIDEKIEKLPAE
ncbi:hypothetical protein CCDG5_0293 [[Clostridium] cellulosi]|uniref:histidine kinase n=1 Tax=[Clostridium] cellulosi TaxID=29343 RepID=A0A078KIQ5_9FIRM|nr:hypothetical protein CCDG5_0293 [[Clostridium] cellulosi]